MLTRLVRRSFGISKATNCSKTRIPQNLLIKPQNAVRNITTICRSTIKNPYPLSIHRPFSTDNNAIQTFEINETTTNEVLLSVVQDICKDGLQPVIDANTKDLVVLIRVCQILASRDITYAQLLLGLIYSKNTPHRNDKEALHWFKQAATPKDNIPEDTQSRYSAEENIRVAQYAVGVALITGNAQAAFTPEHFSGNPDHDFLEVENSKFYLGDGYVIPRNIAERDPTFDFRKWLRQERKKNKKASELETHSQEGIQWLEKSFFNGYQEAALALSHIYMYGYGSILNDTKKGLYWLEQSASQEFPPALFTLGKHYLEGQYIEPDLRKGVECILKSADLGYSEAQYWLGYAFEAGVCVEEDSEKSIRYLKLAAEQNHGGACYYLSQMYRLGGEKVEKSTVLFLDYLEKAAELKNGDALFCIADMYYNGTDGLEKDYTKALRYYKEAARTGHANAFVNEAVMYYHGLGTSVDMQRAFYAYQNAISLDPYHVGALYSIASMLESGAGTPKNEELAKYFLQRAQEAEAKSE